MVCPCNCECDLCLLTLGNSSLKCRALVQKIRYARREHRPGFASPLTLSVHSKLKDTSVRNAKAAKDFTGIKVRWLYSKKHFDQLGRSE